MLQRHATDVVSLVAGTIFAGVTTVWLLTLGDVIDLEAAWLAGPLVLIIAGVVGLVAAFRPSRPSATPTTASGTFGSTAGGDLADPTTSIDSDMEPTTAVDDGEDDVEPTTRIDDDDTESTTAFDAPLGGGAVDTASAGEEHSRDRTD